MTVLGSVDRSSRLVGLGLCLVAFSVTSGAAIGAARAIPVFINEIHYDNVSTDTGEAIEVAGPAGTDLTGWSIVLYNGSGGSAYETISLGGVLPSQQNGFGTLAFLPSGSIQNGTPDGLALVDSGSEVQQLLSYEGAFTATDGPAVGLTSVDIGVFEDGFTPLGYSLQLIGAGLQYEDFSWASPMQNTFSAVNTNQTFVPEPATALLLAFGIAMLGMSGRRRRSMRSA